MILLIITPLIAAVIVFLLPSDRYRPSFIALTAGLHLVLTFRLQIGEVSPEGWLAVDPLGFLVLCV